MKIKTFTFTILLALSASLVPTSFVAQAQTEPTVLSTQFGVHEFNIAALGNAPNRSASVNEIGASFVRLPVSWHLMEGDAKGQTPAWYWEELDADIAAAEAAGLGVLITFGQTPCWASADPLKDCSGNNAIYLQYLPLDPQDYADALGRLVKRYRGRIMAWEIWNEPNLAGNLRSADCGGSGRNRGICERTAARNDVWQSFGGLKSANQYAELVRLGAAAAVKSDPRAKVLAGSIAGGDTQFLQRMYTAGIGNDYYAVSMHPYTAPTPGSANGTSFGPNECPVGKRNAAFWCFADGVEAIHNTMQNNGDHRDIWFTEFGFASTDTWNGSGMQGQAQHLAEAIELIDSWSFVPVAAWYQLVDQGPDDREGTFGLYDQAGQLKPAGRMYRDLLAGRQADTDTIDVIGPEGSIRRRRPAYRWRAVEGATQYRLYVNQYARNDRPGKINRVLTPEQLGCQDGGVCKFRPRRRIFGSGEWWVAAYFEDGSSIESDGTTFRRRHRR